MSYPHTKKVELGMGVPVSVSKGIDGDRFKTEMSSTPLWLQFMRHGGIGALLSRLVHQSDLKLQVFKFCNKFFVELRLAFGTASSPALFDWPICVLTRSSMLSTGIPNQLVQNS